MDIPNNQSTGFLAEEDAFHFLKGKGLTLLERNYQCKTGEIDLIMQDKDTVVFVEVRKRTNPHFPDTSLTWEIDIPYSLRVRPLSSCCSLGNWCRLRDSHP